MRCLERYIAREVYRSLTADLADLTTHQLPTVATSIICGAGFIGRRRIAIAP
jgi:hypothetical protein